MDFDVDLMRELLFDLESKQTSSGATVVISLDAEAMDLGRHVRDIEVGLATLRDFAYIAGPEAEAPGFFPFRELTEKGTAFLRATRRPATGKALSFTLRRGASRATDRLVDKPQSLTRLRP